MTPVTNGSYVGRDLRTAPRSDVYARLPVTLPDGRSTTVTVVNISADGLLMRVDHAAQEGGLVTVSLPVIGKVRGSIVWCIGGRAGIQFNNSIAVADYIPLLRALGARFSEG